MFVSKGTGLDMNDVARTLGTVARRGVVPLLFMVACARSPRPAEPPSPASAGVDAGAHETAAPSASGDAGGPDASAQAASAEAAAPEPSPPPEPIHAIHPEQWFDALKSNARPVELPGFKCLRDIGGCPFEIVDLPECPEGQPVAEVKTHAEVAKWVGVETVFRGSLTSPLPEMRACSPSCCQKGLVPRVFRVSLLGEPTSGAQRNPWTQLWLYHPQFPLAFSCFKDDFVQCCPMPPAKHALVSGTLARSDRYVSAPELASAFGYRMEDARLCRERSSE